VLSLGVVPPFYVVIKGLEARWFSANKNNEFKSSLGTTNL